MSNLSDNLLQCLAATQPPQLTRIGARISKQSLDTEDMLSRAAAFLAARVLERHSFPFPGELMPDARQTDTFQMFLQQALEASAANDAENALRLLRLASAETPSSGLPQFLLGAELAQLGRVDEAEVAYANAVLLAPEFHIARYELGTLQFTSGRAALALVTWQPLLLLPENDALNLFTRGYAELAQDSFDSALRYFAQGMRANTSNEALNSNIRILVAGIEQARTSNAVEAQPTETEGNHFLVANYGRDRPLH